MYFIRENFQNFRQMRKWALWIRLQVFQNLLETDPPMTEAEDGVRGDEVVPELEAVAVAAVVEDLWWRFEPGRELELEPELGPAALAGGSKVE